MYDAFIEWNIVPKYVFSARSPHKMISAREAPAVAYHVIGDRRARQKVLVPITFFTALMLGTADIYHSRWHLS